MQTRIFQVDAFAKEPFKGNPAGVCLLQESKSDGWMQAVAAEMNCSETAFLMKEGDLIRLRWFTPALEVALCGHATLASSHILWEEGVLRPDENAEYMTLSGRLSASRKGDLIELDFPAKREVAAEPPEGLEEALGAKVLYVGRNEFDYLALLEDETAVRALEPDIPHLKKLPVRGVIATARSASAGFDFVSRFFAPAAGVDEDPVTGSAHCCLCPFWAERLGKIEMMGYQASKRGGAVGVRLDGERVFLSGTAVTVLRGTLTS